MESFHINNISKVLFVDDQKDFLELLKIKLKNEKFEVFFSDNIDDAISLLETQDIDVIVSDINMPQKSGIDFFKELKKNFPKVVRIALSGLSQVTTVISAINEGDIFKYITKPWKVNNEGKKIIYEAIEYSMFQKLRLSCEYDDEHLSIEKLKVILNEINPNYKILEINDEDVEEKDIIINSKYFLSEK